MAGTMGDRVGKGRRRYDAGTWLVLLAVFLNAMANVVFAPLPAWAQSDVEWIQICSADGIRSIAVERDNEADGEDSTGGYCPACPLCPAWQGAAASLPVPVVAPSLPMGIVPVMWPQGAGRTGKALATHFPLLSRAPPALV